MRVRRGLAVGITSTILALLALFTIQSTGSAEDEDGANRSFLVLSVDPHTFDSEVLIVSDHGRHREVMSHLRASWLSQMGSLGVLVTGSDRNTIAPDSVWLAHGFSGPKPEASAIVEIGADGIAEPVTGASGSWVSDRRFAVIRRHGGPSPELIVYELLGDVVDATIEPGPAVVARQVESVTLVAGTVDARLVGDTVLTVAHEGSLSAVEGQGRTPVTGEAWRWETPEAPLSVIPTRDRFASVVAVAFPVLGSVGSVVLEDGTVSAKYDDATQIQDWIIEDDTVRGVLVSHDGSLAVDRRPGGTFPARFAALDGRVVAAATYLGRTSRRGQ